MTRPRRFVCPIVARKWLTDRIVSLWIEAPEIAALAKPGQFVGLTVPFPNVLLRRPISIADVASNKVRLIFQIVGRGTELLSLLRVRDRVDVLGPLGRPIALHLVRRPATASLWPVLCGGGVGAAPLLFLARKLRLGARLRVFLGARTKNCLILLREFRGLGAQVEVATDDGSAGYHGSVTQLLESKIGNGNTYDGVSAVFACGPRLMLRHLVKVVDPLPVWGFVEERMGCGTGICYCCALPRKGGGYVRFCQKGPVVMLNNVEL